MPLNELRHSIATVVAVLYTAGLPAWRLGHHIYLPGRSLMDHPRMHTGAPAMSILGLGLCSLADWLHRRLCPWQLLR
jgi:hypothetical protein